MAGAAGQKEEEEESFSEQQWSNVVSLPRVHEAGVSVGLCSSNKFRLYMGQENCNQYLLQACEGAARHRPNGASTHMSSAGHVPHNAKHIRDLLLNPAAAIFLAYRLRTATVCGSIRKFVRLLAQHVWELYKETDCTYQGDAIGVSRLRGRVPVTDKY